jgi:hypothetical protein
MRAPLTRIVRLPHRGLALAVALLVATLAAGCRADSPPPGAPPASPSVAAIDGNPDSGTIGAGGAGGAGVDDPQAGTPTAPASSPSNPPGPPPPAPTPPVCGTVEPWDGDGDAVSDPTEQNNPAFDRFACDTDPSRPEGTFYSGRLDGGVNLTDRGPGYRHLRGSDAVDSDDWASLALVNCIESVGRAWEASGRRINVNDLSQRPGGRFRPHRSHQNGLDADLRYVRKDGADAPLDLRRAPEAYDAAATQELLRLFLRHCDVALFFADVDRLGFADSDLASDRDVLAYAPGHSNHFHLRLNPPVRREARRRAPIFGAPFGGTLALAGAPLLAQLQAQPQPRPRPRPPLVQVDRRPRAVAAPSTAQPIPPVSAALLVQRDAADRRTIVRGDLATRRRAVLYRTDRALVYDLAVSPDNRFTAALESTDGVVVDGEYTEPPNNRLVILDARGRVVRRVEADAQHYRFSPDGQKVAYLTGTHYEGGVGFQPTGVFVLDLASGATERVAAEDVYELDWGAAAENSLLLRALARTPERRVLRYDLRARRLSAMPAGAFHLSPDGQAFLKQPHELIEEGSCQPGRQKPADCFGVFDRRTGRPLAKPAADLGRPVGWAGDQGHLLLLTRQQAASRTEGKSVGRLRFQARLAGPVTQAESRLWDPTAAKVVRTIPGAVMTGTRPDSWIAAPTRLLHERPAGAAARPALERLTLEPATAPPR